VEKRRRRKRRTAAAAGVADVAVQTPDVGTRLLLLPVHIKGDDINIYNNYNRRENDVTLIDSLTCSDVRVTYSIISVSFANCP